MLTALCLTINCLAQDLTHEVPANTEKWPVPSVKEEWKLEYLAKKNSVTTSTFSLSFCQCFVSVQFISVQSLSRV